MQICFHQNLEKPPQTVFITKSVPNMATFNTETLKVLSLGIAITIRYKVCIEIRSRIRFQK